MGRPSRPRFGLRGHWKCGGSVVGGTVAKEVPAVPGKATAVLVVPSGVVGCPANTIKKSSD